MRCVATFSIPPYPIVIRLRRDQEPGKEVARFLRKREDIFNFDCLIAISGFKARVTRRTRNCATSDGDDKKLTFISYGKQAS